MTEHAMKAMSAALEMVDRALQKPISQPELCLCDFCHRHGRQDQGESFADMWLCQDCKDWGNALYLVARTLANRVGDEGPIVVGFHPDTAQALIRFMRLSDHVWVQNLAERLDKALARYERNKP